MYLIAMPIMNSIGKTVAKIVLTDVSQPVVFALTSWVMAIGVKIATNRKPTAKATIVPAVTAARLFFHNFFQSILFTSLSTLYISYFAL